MHFRFLHCADVHLGRGRSLGEQRYGDYFEAFASLVEYATEEKVDAVLVAGDFFDEQEPSAETIRRAAAGLRPLRDAGIPVYAIEGNHDRRKRTEPACALDILAGEGYMHLLRPSLNEQKLLLDLYRYGQGGLVRLGKHVSIAGIGFFGHNIEDYHRQAAEQLPGSGCTILLSHTMVVGDTARLEYGYCLYEEIAALRERVTYLGLGHRHTRLGLHGEFDGWVFNPGAMEFVHTHDFRQDSDLRGFLDVRVDGPDTPSAPGKYAVSATHIPTEKRPAVTLRVDISGASTPDGVLAAVRSSVEWAGLDRLVKSPIVIVRLEGTLALSRSRLPRAAIAALLTGEFGAIHVEVMERDVLGGDTVSALLIDEGGLELVADRARAIAAGLLGDSGIAVGREAELAGVLLDMKQQLHGSAKTPSSTVLRGVRQQLLPFVEYDGDMPEHSGEREDTPPETNRSPATGTQADGDEGEEHT